MNYLLTNIEKLYNSVPSIVEEQHELMSKLECDCHEKCTHKIDCHDTHKINVSHVSMTVRGIKSAKRDGTCNMYTDHLTTLSNYMYTWHFSAQRKVRSCFSPIQFCTSISIAIPNNTRNS